MVKLPWTHFTGDRRHVEVMGLLTAWMKHDRGAQSINYPGAIFFFFFFFKDHGSLLLAMRSLRSQSVKGDSGERTCSSLDGL